MRLKTSIPEHGRIGFLRIKTTEQPDTRNPFKHHLLKKNSVETGMNGNGYHVTMKNCEGTTGSRNRLFEKPGAEFSGN